MPQTSFEDKKQKIVQIVCSCVKNAYISGGKITDLDSVAKNVAGNVMEYLEQVSSDEFAYDVIEKLNQELACTKKQLSKMKKTHDILAKQLGLFK